MAKRKTGAITRLAKRVGRGTKRALRATGKFIRDHKVVLGAAGLAGVALGRHIRRRRRQVRNIQLLRS